MFVKIGEGFYNSADIRWIQKQADTVITIAFKNESDMHAIEVEFDSEEERDKEWGKIGMQLVCLLCPSTSTSLEKNNPFYVHYDNNGAIPV